MYDWPGYIGMSPYLRTFTLRPAAGDKRIEVVIPAGTVATVLLPSAQWTQNGAPVKTSNAENGARASVILSTAGKFVFLRQ
jgi:hypothetical protein